MRNGGGGTSYQLRPLTRGPAFQGSGVNQAPPLIVSPGEPEEAPAAGSRAPDPSAGGSAGRSRRGEGFAGRRQARGAGGWGGRPGPEEGGRRGRLARARGRDTQERQGRTGGCTRGRAGGYGVGAGGGWSEILEKGLGRGDFLGGGETLRNFFGVGKFSVGVGEGSERLLVGARI